MPVSALKANVMFSYNPPPVIYYRRQKIKFGQVWIGTTKDEVICILDFTSKLSEWRCKWPKTEFIKTSRKASFNSKILLCGTKFQQKVWKALLDISCGQTISYAEMAQRVRKPKAARAIGNALGANPVPIIIPCHRVIASDGSIGGYGGGIRIKQKLLREEKALLPKGKN